MKLAPIIGFGGRLRPLLHTHKGEKIPERDFVS